MTNFQFLKELRNFRQRRIKITYFFCLWLTFWGGNIRMMLLR